VPSGPGAPVPVPPGPPLPRSNLAGQDLVLGSGDGEIPMQGTAGVASDRYGQSGPFSGVLQTPATACGTTFDGTLLLSSAEGGAPLTVELDAEITGAMSEAGGTLYTFAGTVEASGGSAAYQGSGWAEGTLRTHDARLADVDADIWGAGEGMAPTGPPACAPQGRGDTAATTTSTSSTAPAADQTPVPTTMLEVTRRSRAAPVP
jgi:hypothetical protein